MIKEATVIIIALFALLSSSLSQNLGDENVFSNAEWIAFRPEQQWKEAWNKRKQREQETFMQGQFPYKNGKYWSIWDHYVFHENPYDAAPYFRKTFLSQKTIKQATLNITGLGYYVAYINGQRISADELTPAWTDYNDRVFYNSYDVTSLLSEGKNALGIQLGRGYYGQIANDQWGFYKNDWIGQPTLISCLVIDFKDGSSISIVSDESWKTIPSPIVVDDPSIGEL